MFERFTDPARGVVVHAQEEARRFDHDHIGTEHILLGLLYDDTEKAGQVLVAAGVVLDVARGTVDEVIGRGPEPSPGAVPFTLRAKKILELSLREALRLGHNYIGTEHILLGISREADCGGARVLRHLGVDLDELRDEIFTLLRADQRPSSFPGGFGGAGGIAVAIENRLAAIEDRLERIERLLKDSSARDSA